MYGIKHGDLQEDRHEEKIDTADKCDIVGGNGADINTLLQKAASLHSMKNSVDQEM